MQQTTPSPTRTTRSIVWSYTWPPRNVANGKQEEVMEVDTDTEDEDQEDIAEGVDRETTKEEATKGVTKEEVTTSALLPLTTVRSSHRARLLNE